MAGSMSPPMKAWPLPLKLESRNYVTERQRSDSASTESSHSTLAFELTEGKVLEDANRTT